MHVSCQINLNSNNHKHCDWSQYMDGHLLNALIVNFEPKQKYMTEWKEIENDEKQVFVTSSNFVKPVVPFLLVFFFLRDEIPKCRRRRRCCFYAATLWLSPAAMYKFQRKRIRIAYK